MTHTIEIAEFKLADGKTAAEIAASYAGTLAFAQDQKGFIARTLSCDEGGNYLDHVEWETMEDASAAGEAFMKDPRNGEFMKCIAPNDISMRHYQKLG